MVESIRGYSDENTAVRLLGDAVTEDEWRLVRHSDSRFHRPVCFGDASAHLQPLPTQAVRTAFPYGMPGVSIKQLLHPTHGRYIVSLPGQGGMISNAYLPFPHAHNPCTDCTYPAISSALNARSTTISSSSVMGV